MKIFIKHLSMFLIAICFSIHTSLISADSNENIKRTFKVKEGGTLTVDTDLGSIDVKTSSNKIVDVEVIRELKGWGSKRSKDLIEKFRVDFNQNEGDVEVIGKKEENWTRKWNDIRIKFIITVPKKYNVNLNTSGGGISVDDLDGEVKAKTSGGSLHFGNIVGYVDGKTSGGGINLAGCQADVNIRTSGGSISIGDVEGNVNAHTSGGSIKIEKAMGEIIAQTSGGGIKIEEAMGAIDASTSGGSVTAYISRQPTQDCHLKTSGGSVKIYLANNISVDVDAKTSSGRVKSEFDITGVIKKESIRGEINGGGPELYLRTSGGGISILKK